MTEKGLGLPITAQLDGLKQSHDGYPALAGSS